MCVWVVLVFVCVLLYVQLISPFSQVVHGGRSNYRGVDQTNSRKITNKASGEVSMKVRIFLLL